MNLQGAQLKLFARLATASESFSNEICQGLMGGGVDRKPLGGGDDLLHYMFLLITEAYQTVWFV